MVDRPRGTAHVWTTDSFQLKQANFNLRKSTPIFMNQTPTYETQAPIFYKIIPKLFFSKIN